ncbi:tape measure protein [Chitinophaga sp. sic0106]|uniref:tape measure protein n=1 Tax=Chitinophaga sp. sic0106 TaxID=2854785 RepID=UPI001C491899|nr:tape measure protein [Chitinophaga sp. sic0106]MBV7531347.1 tape measure protein [Chitinophaga sp. sic0106]
MSADDKINSVIDEGRVNRQLENLFDLLGKAIGMIKEVHNAAKGVNFGNGFKDMANALKEARVGSDAYKKARAEATEAESALRQELLKTKNAYEALRLAEAQAAAERRKNKQNVVSEIGSLNELRERLKAMTREWDSYGPATRKANQALLNDLKAVRKEVGDLEAQTGRYQRNVGNYPSRLVGGLSSLIGQFGVPLTAAAAAKEIFDQTVAIDSLNSAMKAVSGTEEEFNKNQNYLIDLSERLGLNVLDLTKAYKLFYAASTQAGLSADQTRKIFTSVSEAAATLKFSADDTQGVLLAFSQILGKGKVQAEELRGQIGERLPGAFAIAARSIGVTQVQLNKMLENGELIASEFLPRFAAELEKTFGRDSQEKVESLQGEINRLSNEFTSLVSSNESGLTRFFTYIISAARSATAAIREMADGINYVYTKLTDSEGFNSLQTESIGKQVRADARNASTQTLLDQRDLQTDNIAKTEENLAAYQRHLAFIEQESKKTYNRVLDSDYKAAEKAVKDAELLLQRQKAVRQAVVDELTTRFTNSPEQGPITPGASKKDQNQQQRLRELQLKALLDLQKISDQEAIDGQKEIAENEKNTLAERMQAAENYFDLRNIQARKEADSEKKLVNEQVKQGKAVSEQLLVVDAKFKSEKLKNASDLNKMLSDILKDNADDNTKQIAHNAEVQKASLQQLAQEELRQVASLYKRRLISQEQYEAEKLRIANKFTILGIQEDIKAAEAMLDIQKLRGEDTRDLESKLLELKNKLRDADLEYFTKSEESKAEVAKAYATKHLELQKDLNGRLKDLALETFSFAKEIGEAQFTNEKNRLQSESDEVDKAKERQIAALDNQLLSEQEKANKVAVIDAQAQTQKENIARRQRDVDVRAAQFQKAISLFQIAITTAENVFKIQAQAAALAATPIVGPALAAQALAQIPFVLAAGAVQAAAVAVAPIPRYKHGTDRHPGGYAFLGDGGQNEVGLLPDGTAFMSPARDTLYDLPADTKVFPSLDRFYEAMAWSAFKPIPEWSDPRAGGAMAEKIVKGLGGKLDKVEKAIAKKAQVKVMNWTKEGINEVRQEDNKFTKYINKYMR